MSCPSKPWSFKKKYNHSINNTFGTINSNLLPDFNTSLSLVDATCFKNVFPWVVCWSQNPNEVFILKISVVPIVISPFFYYAFFLLYHFSFSRLVLPDVCWVWFCESSCIFCGHCLLLFLHLIFIKCFLTLGVCTIFSCLPEFNTISLLKFCFLSELLQLFHKFWPVVSYHSVLHIFLDFLYDFFFNPQVFLNFILIFLYHVN